MDEVTTVELTLAMSPMMIQLAKDAGQTVDAKTIGGLFAALDVSEQSPFVAMARRPD